MSKKRLKGDGIHFLGRAASEVTGSQYLVKFGEYKILLECGLYQSSSNSYLDSYKINSEKFKFKPSEIDYVFVAHPHIDHCGLVPRLVKEGFSGKIITTANTAKVMKPLLLNSSYILASEAKILSKKYKRSYAPIYLDDDVRDTLELVEVYDDYNVLYELNDNIKFQWLQNSHCIGAAQLQLVLQNETKSKKILYTSDIGALKSENHFVSDTEIPQMFNDIVIMESTYGDASRETNKSRSFDNEHLKTAIETVINREGTVILPCFSFARTQELLSTIYDIFGKDESFYTPVIVDSKLSCEISKLYNNLLDEEDLKYWQDVCNWKNVKFIVEKPDSQMMVANPEPKIIISSSGFCTNGRIVNYIKKYLQDENSMIIFSGYAGDNPSYLSYRIKNYRDHRTISINKTPVDNNADCVALSTFSSHAGHKDLIKYGSSLNTNKLVLVHGSEDSKKCLAEKLKSAISQNDKTYKVSIAAKDMIIKL